MRLILFNKVIFEGTKEGCEAFRIDLIKTLHRMGDELEKIYPNKRIGTHEEYFEELKTLNPFVYETLSYFKEVAGEYLVNIYFDHIDLIGVRIWVYDDLEAKTKRGYSFAKILLTISLGRRKQNFWKIEE